MDFVAWLSGQTHRTDTVGNLATAVTASNANVWRTGSADEVLRAGFNPADISIAAQEYFMAHMENPFDEEIQELKERES